MSIKNNTTSLQDLLEQVNALPEAENLDAELATQDDLITQIQSAVDNLPEAGSAEPALQEKTVTPTTSEQTVTPDSGYDGLSEVTVNAMPTATQATPSITVSSAGLITASSTQSAGYVTSGTKSATKQLTTQAAKTITPSTAEQVAVSAGTYVTGDIIVTAIESGSGSGDSSGSGGNMVTVVNNTGQYMVIGLYRLEDGESVQLPCNISSGMTNVSFITGLAGDTLVNSTASITSVTTEAVSVSMSSGTSLTCKTGYLILNAANIGTTLEISLA